MKNPNIILIVIDALRQDHLGCYGYGKRTSPNIDRIAKEGIVFEEAYATTNATDPSITSILSGKFPRCHGILYHGKPNQTLINTNLLPEILKSKGYITLGLDWLGRWFKRGFDHYHDATTSEITNIASSFLEKYFPTKIQSTVKLIYKKLIGRKYGKERYEAERVTDYAINLLEKHKNNKFFLFIHYWDTHIPYNPPRKYITNSESRDGLKVKDILNSIKNDKWRAYLKENIGEEKTVKEVVEKYDGAVRFVDENIGKLYDALNDLGIKDNTMLIITSDHGEGFGEHDVWFDHHCLYDALIKVPLIIWYPGFEAKRINAMVQHIDIVPTILDMLQIKTDLDGKSLLPLINKEVNEFRKFIFAEETFTQQKRCIRTRDYKYILSDSKENAICRYCGFIHGGVEELYNIVDDPKETKNIVGEKRNIAENLREKLIKIVRNLDEKGNEQIERQIDEAIEELKNLT
jgi:arylsulfatase A-like enzyme